MKMVKSLLLGSAAGLVAIAGAQAADLPVKAKPVEYVKICSAYGAGFYYIPGTDICLRVGGYAFVETGYNARVGDAYIYTYTIGPDLVLNQDDNRVNFRARGTVILDARSQTAIGTVRTYVAFGADFNNNINGIGAGGNVGAYLERAFIQFAGFTAGQSASFFDFGGWYSTFALSSVAWDWLPVFAYTANFGNGFSATLSVEDGQARRIKWATTIFTGTASAGNAYGGQEVPDLIANLRVDQAWGSAQVSGALHQLRPNQAWATAGTPTTYGWAVLGGIEIKTPMIAPGDSITLQGVYSRGAVEYTGLSASPLGVTQGIGLKNLLGVGPALDVFDIGSTFVGGAWVSSDLTNAWSANLFFRHFWQPNLWSGFWVGYNRVEPQGNYVALFGHPADLTVVQAGSKVNWSPAPTLDLSLDVLWSRVEVGACASAALAIQIASCNQATDIWAVWTRWRRNF